MRDDLYYHARMMYINIVLFLIAAASLVCFGITIHEVRANYQSRHCEVYIDGKCEGTELVK